MVFSGDKVIFANQVVLFSSKLLDVAAEVMTSSGRRGGDAVGG